MLRIALASVLGGSAKVIECETETSENKTAYYASNRLRMSNGC